MVNKPLGDEQAQLDELGNDPGQVGPDSAGQSGDPQRLSSIEDVANESVQELASTDQALEAGIVEGVEDAADHPGRPAHTHLEYGRPDDLPPHRDSVEFDDGELDDQGPGAGNGEARDVDVEDLADPGDSENTAA